MTIYRESDLKSQQLWDRVQDLHRQAISMEAAAIAAERLEGHDHGDHANEAARPANTSRAAAPAPVKSATAVIEGDDQAEKTAAASTPKQNAEERRAARIDDRDDAKERKTNRREERSAQESAHAGKDEATGWQALDGDLNIVAIRVGVAQPDGRVREYLLTQPGQNDDSGSNQSFRSHQSQLTLRIQTVPQGVSIGNAKP